MAHSGSCLPYYAGSPRQTKPCKRNASYIKYHKTKTPLTWARNPHDLPQSRMTIIISDTACHLYISNNLEHPFPSKLMYRLYAAPRKSYATPALLDTIKAEEQRTAQASKKQLQTQPLPREARRPGAKGASAPLLGSSVNKGSVRPYIQLARSYMVSCKSSLVKSAKSRLGGSGSTPVGRKECMPAKSRSPPYTYTCACTYIYMYIYIYGRVCICMYIHTILVDVNRYVYKCHAGISVHRSMSMSGKRDTSLFGIDLLKV